MLILAHLGNGAMLARLLAGRKGMELPLRWLLVGTLLPDLVDKPAYLLAVVLTGRRGAELGILSGTRTFGHTLVFVLAWIAVGWWIWRRSGRKTGLVLATLGLGAATHLVLDLLDNWLGGSKGIWEAGVRGIFFPFLGMAFPIDPNTSEAEHLTRSFGQIHILIFEIIGALLLMMEFWRQAKSRRALRRAGSA